MTDGLLSGESLELVVEYPWKVDVDPLQRRWKLRQAPRASVESCREVQHEIDATGSNAIADDLIEHLRAHDHRPRHLAPAGQIVDDRFAVCASQLRRERIVEERVGSARFHRPIEGNPAGGVGYVSNFGHLSASAIAAVVETAARSQGTQTGIRATRDRPDATVFAACVVSALTISDACCGRSPGFFSRLFMTIAASSGGVSARRVATCSAVSRAWAAMIACGVRPRNGRCPVTISYATTPSA